MVSLSACARPDKTSPARRQGDLFVWQAEEAERRQRWQSAPLAIRRIALRHGLPLETAATIAGLAGLGARHD